MEKSKKNDKHSYGNNERAWQRQSTSDLSYKAAERSAVETRRRLHQPLAGSVCDWR